MPDAHQIPRVLTIAGSDSSGGAGVQADLKAFARCGVYGLTAITAVTAQSTLGVSAIHVVPPAVVAAQIEAVVRDIGVDAVKVGMLAGGATTVAVAGALREYVPASVPIVVDPILASSSGAELLSDDGVEMLLAELLAMTTVLTPNRPEALALVARSGGVVDHEDDHSLARAVLALGASAVVLTGGHRAGDLGDLYCDHDQAVEIGGERYASRATHGSGCTHSAVLAAELARGHSPLESARAAAAVAAQAVRDGLEEIGHGAGPVDALGLHRREETAARAGRPLR